MLLILSRFSSTLETCRWNAVVSDVPDWPQTIVFPLLHKLTLVFGGDSPFAEPPLRFWSAPLLIDLRIGYNGTLASAFFFRSLFPSLRALTLVSPQFDSESVLLFLHDHPDIKYFSFSEAFSLHKILDAIVTAGSARMTNDSFSFGENLMDLTLIFPSLEEFDSPPTNNVVPQIEQLITSLRSLLIASPRLIITLSSDTDQYIPIKYLTLLKDFPENMRLCSR